MRGNAHWLRNISTWFDGRDRREESARHDFNLDQGRLCIRLNRHCPIKAQMAISPGYFGMTNRATADGHTTWNKLIIDWKINCDPSGRWYSQRNQPSLIPPAQETGNSVRASGALSSQRSLHYAYSSSCNAALFPMSTGRPLSINGRGGKREEMVGAPSMPRRRCHAMPRCAVLCGNMLMHVRRCV